MLLGFVSVIISILIVFGSPTMWTTLDMLLSFLITGELSSVVVVALFVLLIIVEFLMFNSIIYFSIVMGYKSREKKVLNSFVYTVLMAFASMFVLSIIMLIVLLINGLDLSSSVLVLSYPALLSIVLTGIIVYSAISVLFYFLAKKEFKKGVNVD